jgi:hypothetical protein
MTETLNYDPKDPDAPEFSEDEQNSLEVAEKLGQEENELLAGKYKNAEDLEEAYLELQKKLGSDDDEVEDTTLDEDEVELDEATADAVNVIQDASAEYYENEGAGLSAETMEEFAKMDSRDLVNAFVAIQENSPETVGGGPDLTDAEMGQVYNSVGGEEEYGKLTSWAADNMEDKALDAFNSIIDAGNRTAIQIAVAGMKAEYDNQEGYEGRMLQGKAASNSRDGFRSQAEVVQAMSDPRYDRDPAYRQDLYDKLERSNVAF